MPPISPDRWRALSPVPRRSARDCDGATGRLAGVDLRARMPRSRPTSRRCWPSTAGRARVALSGAGGPRSAHGADAVAGGTGRRRLPAGLAASGRAGSGSVWLAERCDGRFRGTRRGQAAEHRADRPRRRRTVQARRHAFSRACSIRASRTSSTPASRRPASRISCSSTSTARASTATATIARSASRPALRLFLDVLEAVAHAHANLIVHRDIKPRQRARQHRWPGQAARLRHRQADRARGPSWGATGTAEPSALTREGGAALTPEYAAPEQLAGGSRHHGDRRLCARRAALRAAERPASRGPGRRAPRRR